MKARKVRKLLRKRRRVGESAKACARRLSQDAEGNAFIGDVTAQWLKNKKPFRVKIRTNHVPKKEEAAPPPKPSKGGKRK